MYVNLNHRYHIISVRYIYICYVCTVYDVVERAGFRLTDSRHEEWYVSAAVLNFFLVPPI